MSHELHRLTQKIKTEPQLITSVGMEGVLGYLESRNFGEVELAVTGGKKRDVRELQYVDASKTGIISVKGPLSYLEYTPMCAEEAASYQRIVREFEAMVETGAKTVVFDIDTPGGQAYGCFESAAEVRRIADEKGVRILGYVDGSATSAGYAWLSVMHEKIGNPDSQVGSIGVMVHLVNAAKARKAIGLEDVYIYAGDSKIPWDKEGNLREEFINRLQTSVEKTYDDFLSHVSVYTGIGKETLRNTKAEVFDADEALSIGLLDANMTRADFLDYLVDIAEARQEGKTMSITERFKTKAKKEETSETMTTKDQEAVAALQEQMTGVQAKNEELATTVTALNETLSTLTEKLHTANQVIEEFKAKEVAVAEEAKEKLKTTRLEKLEAVMTKEHAAEMNDSLALLSDVAFEAVVSKLKVAEAQEENTPEFKEKGVAGEASAEEQDKKYALVSEMIAKQNKDAK